MLKAWQGALAAQASPPMESCAHSALPSASPDRGVQQAQLRERWHGAMLPGPSNEVGRTQDPRPYETNWRVLETEPKVGSPHVICTAGCLRKLPPPSLGPTMLGLCPHTTVHTMTSWAVAPLPHQRLLRPHTSSRPTRAESGKHQPWESCPAQPAAEAQDQALPVTHCPARLLDTRTLPIPAAPC